MDSTDKLWLSRGEALGRLLSECRRTPSQPTVSRPAEPRPAVDPLADPLEAARFSASIALAMRNGATDRAKQARAEAMLAAFRWLARTVRAGFRGRHMTGDAGAHMPAPVSLHRRSR